MFAETFEYAYHKVKFNEFFVDVVLHLPQQKYGKIDTLYKLYNEKELARNMDLKYNTNIAEQIEFVIKQENSDEPKKWC